MLSALTTDLDPHIPHLRQDAGLVHDQLDRLDRHEPCKQVGAQAFCQGLQQLRRRLRNQRRHLLGNSRLVDRVGDIVGAPGPTQVDAQPQIEHQRTTRRPLPIVDADQGLHLQAFQHDQVGHGGANSISDQRGVAKMPSAAARPSARRCHPTYAIIAALSVQNA